jgi:hypothetical protein
MDEKGINPPLPLPGWMRTVRVLKFFRKSNNPGMKMCRVNAKPFWDVTLQNYLREPG